MTKILIGIDDTDNQTSRGTGHLARLLCRECQKRGLTPVGVTRHQFLIDSRIPYTSHNSGACIALLSPDGLGAADFAFDFVAQQAATGSDPGLCLAQFDTVNDDVFRFALAATTQIVTMEDAFAAARASCLCLRGLGGTCLGVIGAIASVGLCAKGNQGRFIDLPGLRNLPEKVDADTFANLGVRLQYQDDGKTPQPHDIYNTLGWVRPRLMKGEPVLFVEWSKDKNAWIPVDRKKSRPLE